MAERRMISKKIVESGKFLKMPQTTQNLYFHLVVNADDDGIVEAYTVMNMIKASEDDLRILVSKQFVTILDPIETITYINDWRQQNLIRADRKQDSIYLNLLLQVVPDALPLQKKPRADRNNT